MSDGPAVEARSISLMGLYADPASGCDEKFRRRWTASGRRLDLGRSCLRFRTLDDLDADLLRETLGALSVDDDDVGLDERRLCRFCADTALCISRSPS